MHDTVACCSQLNKHWGKSHDEVVEATWIFYFYCRINHLADHIVERTSLPDHLIRNVSGELAFEEELPRVWAINHFPEDSINKASGQLVQQHSGAFPTERILLQVGYFYQQCWGMGGGHSQGSDLWITSKRTVLTPVYTCNPLLRNNVYHNFLLLDRYLVIDAHIRGRKKWKMKFTWF